MIRRHWSEQVRLTFWAWLATVGAAVMIAPLVYQKTYLVHGAAGAAVLAVVGAALRARGGHWSLIMLAQVAVLAEWSVIVYARGEALWALIPTKAAIVELADRVADFLAMTERYAAPVPPDPDLTMTLALGMMALAIVVDAVAVTWRRVPLLGLLFLAIYMAPVALLGGDVSLFVFIPGAAGFVFLMAADERERLTHWGRQISPTGPVWEDPAEDVNAQGIRSTGRRIGLGAVAAAVVLPVLIPTLSPHYFGESSSSQQGANGGGTTVVTNPVLDLRRNLVEPSDEILIRFSTNDPDPGYLRLASLNLFTEDTWEPGTRAADTSVGSDEGLPAAPGFDSTVPRSGYSYDVEVSDNLVSTWLPLVYAPTGITAEEQWRVDVRSLDAAAADEGQSTAGISYSFSALLSEPTPALLRRAGRRPVPPEIAAFTALPNDNFPAIIGERAREVTEGETSAFGQALALQAWFRSDKFRYSVEASSGTGLETIESFLGDDRVGYCEQFASAMALMARDLGIPARVAVGFLRPDPVGTEYVYRGTDMHTWPELYFDGVGWVRFEPTPGTRTGAAPNFRDNQVAGNTGPGGGRLTDATDPTSTPLTPEELPTPAAAGDSSGSGPWSSTGTALLLIAASLLALVAPRIARTVTARRRWSRAGGPTVTTEAAWAELRDTVVDLRMEWDPQATPRAMGRQLRAQVSNDHTFVQALNRIVLATEQARYARHVSTSGDLREAVRTVSDAVAATRSARTRWLATWLPTSLFGPLRRSSMERARDRNREDALVTVAE